MNLIIDSGNTRIKIYLANSDNLSQIGTFLVDDADKLAAFIRSTEFDNSILCNVGDANYPWIKVMKEQSRFFVNLSSATRLPIRSAYQSAETLGADRLAAVVGSEELFPNADNLVIDVGTAITFDFISQGNYLGGSISPGMRLRFESLHRYTHRLPLLTYTSDYQYPGLSTRDSVISGVVEGVANEIAGTINVYKKEYFALNVVITGGDADIFAGKIKNGIFAEPNLIAKGLNRILTYNVEKI
ncbi:MAG: type III pantothenate kinase [Salinivirgaceae bacterium]|nr:type III pantothenate kinase [Salinivirgaceae bacterium]